MKKPKIKYSKSLRQDLKQSEGPTRVQRYHSRLTAKLKHLSVRHKQRKQARVAKERQEQRAAQKAAQARSQAKAQAKQQKADRKRSHKPNKQKHHIDWTGATIAIIALFCIVGGGTYYIVHSRNAQARQDQIAREQKANEVALTLKATPKSPIFEDGNQIGITDKQGICRLQNVSVGTKLWTQYGKMKSNPIVVTKADKKQPVTFTFNYLKGNQAQRYLTKYYQCVSNLVNHNDQNHKNLNLGNYFVNGIESPAYKNEFKWGKAQYKAIQKNKKNKSDKGDTAKDKQVPFTALHFTVAMQNAVLNEDGSVTLNYGVRDDFAGRVHDHVAVYNMSSVVKLVNGHWQIIEVHKPMIPKVSYNN